MTFFFGFQTMKIHVNIIHRCRSVAKICRSRKVNCSKYIWKG